MNKDIWLYAHYNTYSKETEYQIASYERSQDNGDVLLEKQVLVFDTPNDKELRVKLATALGLKLKLTRAEHYKEEQDQQGVINELLALEYKPESAGKDEIPF